MRLCTYNILANAYIKHARKSGVLPQFCEWEYRRERLLEYIETAVSSNTSLIVGLQEVDAEFSEQLRSLFPNFQHLYSKRKHSVDGLHTLLSADFSMQNYQSLHLMNEQKIERRVAQIIDCKRANQEMRLVNVHLDYDPVGKQDGFLQQHQLLNRLNDSSALPTLIFGDFNMDDSSKTFGLTVHSGFQAIPTQSPTCYVNGQWSRVDHIFHTDDINIHHVHIPSDIDSIIPNAQWGSDHLPIACSVTFIQ